MNYILKKKKNLILSSAEKLQYVYIYIGFKIYLYIIHLSLYRFNAILICYIYLFI